MNLSTIIVQSPGRSPQKEISPSVEGVMLQTVCKKLWEEIDPLGQGLEAIQPEHLGDLDRVDRALAQYCADAVRRAAQSARLRERLIRDWFEEVLITEQGFRSQSDSGPGTDARKAVRCIQALEKQHLIRSEPRLNRPWYELVRDRFVDPIRRDNAAWRDRSGFGDISRRAKAWRAGRSNELLLTKESLSEAIVWLAEHDRDVYDYERKFVKESERTQGELEQEELDRLVAEQRETLYRGLFADLVRSRWRWRMATLLVSIISLLTILSVILIQD